MRLGWFKLIHVCRRWRTVVLGSSSRLDLRFVLTPKISGNMKTIMSRHFPPLPIEISYHSLHRTAKARDIVRMLTALKRRDRIRRITFAGNPTDLKKFFKAADSPLPALESLELRHEYSQELDIPHTFLGGSNSHLRSLKLHYICLSATSQLLTSASALTDLSLGIETVRDSKPSMLLLLTYLQGMPSLHRLKLEIPRSWDEDPYMVWPKDPKCFSLAKLTSFHYFGPSKYLNTLMGGFSGPFLWDVDIRIRDCLFEPLPPIPHLPRFIDNLWEDYHTIEVVLAISYFRLSLLSRTECVGQHSPCFKLCSGRFDESNIQEWMMQMSSAVLARLSTMEELSIIFLDRHDRSELSIPWRTFLQQFPSVKLLRLERTNNLRIASFLPQDREGPDLAFMPALEEIKVRLCPVSTPEYGEATELAAFRPFVSARQKAGHPIKVSLFTWVGSSWKVFPWSD
jgi:hypothetical protein